MLHLCIDVILMLTVMLHLCTDVILNVCYVYGLDVGTGENITELMVAEGWLTVRRESIRGESNLVTLEELAKSQNKVNK